MTTFRYLNAGLVLVPLLGHASGSVPAWATTNASNQIDTAADSVPEPNLLATANGWPIYVEDLERALSDLHSSVAETSRPDFDAESLIRTRLVSDALLATEAAALGMDEEAPIPRRLEALRDQMARGRLEEEAIQSRIKVDPSQVEEIFQSEYRTVTAHMATLKTREEAEAFLEEVRSGADFEDLAKERSVDGLRMRGGLAEGFPFANLPPDIAKTVFDLAPGTLSPPLLNELGWTVFRVESFAAADPDVLPRVEGRIRGLLELRQAEDLRAQLLADLLRKYPPEIDNEAIAAIGCERRDSSGLWPVVPDPNKVLVQVEDRTIHADDLGAALLDRWRDVQNEEAALLTKPLVLDKLIADEVILVEALQRGYGQSQEVQRAQHALLTKLLVGKYLDEVILPSLQITRQEVETYYQEHLQEFRKPPRVRLSQVTVATLQEAEEIATLLRDGADIAWVARQRSIDGFKDKGGDRGWVIAGRVVGPFDGSDLQQIEPGEVLGPKGWEENYVILRVTAIEEQGEYAFEEVSGNVRNRLKSQKFAATMDQTLATLRENSDIQIFDDHIAKLSISADEADDAQPSGHGIH
jgi:peptidyl-prolyl cis-trans isomerase C